MSSDSHRLMAHMLRRAGFGATRQEIDDAVVSGYEATVERLLDTSGAETMADDIIRRFHVDQSELRLVECATANWLYRMMSATCPLQEKIALFWHGLFATGERKVNNVRALVDQIAMFREYGLGSFRTLLVELSRDPAMIFWLDNNDNHRDAINENYGRELLELFSMGIGNYSEDDVKEAARAFTGWTVENIDYMAMKARRASIWPYGRVSWQFDYRPDDHDSESKTFLGETGSFDGEDVIDIIVRNAATARFLCTRLYQFFVSDEISEDGDALIDHLMGVYFDSGYEVKSVLRAIFNSEHFKSGEVRYRKVKSPAELVAGTLRVTQPFDRPLPQIFAVSLATGYMGQELFNPPNVEGWHEGPEWVDSGSLVERVNFAAGYLGDPRMAGVKTIVERVREGVADSPSAEMIVATCLEQLGHLDVSEETRDTLVESVSALGDEKVDDRAVETLRLIGSTREFQMA